MKLWIKTLLFGMLLFCSTAAQAVPLSELFNGGSITAGDKLFDSWELLFHGASDGRELIAGNIEVTALDDGGLNPGPGLSFRISNDELTVQGDGTYAFVDLMFGFRVSVLDSLLRVNGASLELTDGFYSWETGEDIFNDVGFYIRETIGTSPWTENLGVNEIEFSFLDGESIAALDDLTAFLPQSEIWVTKNILVWAGATTDSAGLFDFDQRFSQTQTVIPEPSTVALMLLGGAGLVVARKKKWL